MSGDEYTGSHEELSRKTCLVNNTFTTLISYLTCMRIQNFPVDRSGSYNTIQAIQNRLMRKNSIAKQKK